MTDTKKTAVTAIAWFTAENWRRLLEVTDDRSTLPDTFEEFERIAGAKFARLVAAGAHLEKVLIDADEYAAWCRRNGWRLDRTSRAAFAAALLARRDTGDLPDARAEDANPRPRS